MSSPFSDIISTHVPDLTAYESLYKHLHSNPELSNQESATAVLITNHLRSLPSSDLLDIRTSIGGHGLIAILTNNPGPTVLLRSELDALPVLEKSGLPYASTSTQVDSRDGLTKPTMHTCGHDMHITSLLAAAATLLSSRSSWSGTIIFLFQPAEERGSGALSMINDGLYDPKRHNCPIPDVVLGQHVFPLKSGVITTKPGVAMSAADSLKITIYGRGGHGSMPHSCIDPVVIASHIVVRLQSIVSREVAPDDMAVVTVGSLRAGEAENVIPDEAVLKVNIRTVDENVRKKVKDAVERIVKAECTAGNSPKEPTFEEITSFPLTVNDETVTNKVSSSLSKHFGNHYLKDMKYVLGSEDFSYLATTISKPYCFWFFGGTDAQKYEDAEKAGRIGEDVPVNHSPFFAPVIQPTLRTGVEGLVVGALTFLGKGNEEVN